MSGNTAVSEAKSFRPASAPDFSAQLLAVVDAMVRETHPDRTIEVRLDSRIERDLGLDSLARVELLLRLGDVCHTRFPPEALSEAQTPRDLLRFVGQHDVGDDVVHGSAPPVGASNVPLPDQAQTLVEVLEWHAARQPERGHVVLYDDKESAQTVSYAALLLHARRIAAGLLAEGVEPKQTIALMLPTGVEYLASFFGVLLAGAVPVPIYPPARLSQIEEHLARHGRILANAGAVLIDHGGRSAGCGVVAGDGGAGIAQVGDPGRTRTRADGYPLSGLCRRSGFPPVHLGQHRRPEGRDADPRQPAGQYPSPGARGEGQQRGRFRELVAAVSRYGPDRRLAGVAVPRHAAGSDEPADFSGASGVLAARDIAYRGTLSAAPNFAYELIARKLPDAELAGLDLWSWRLAFNGAEPVIPATLEAFAQRLGGVGFRGTSMTPVYGLAECSVGLAIPPPDRGPRIDSIDRERFARERIAEPIDPDALSAMLVPGCGRALPGHEMRVVDDFDHELAERHVGTLQFRGPSATRGYFRNDDATRKLIRDGWIDSGDYAYLHDGEVYLTGRAKDLIIRGGRNIYPYELEQAVGALSGIRKGCVAVFAATDPVGGTEKLVVMAETRETADEPRVRLTDEINRISIDVVGMPADEIVLAPPYTVLKTSSGKIRRAASREIFERGAIGGRRSSAWWQIVRLASAAASVARSARTCDRRQARCYGLYAWLVFGLLAVPTWTITALARQPAVGRVTVHLATRCFSASDRDAGAADFCLSCAGQAACAGMQPRELPRFGRAVRDSSAAGALCLRGQARTG